VSSRLGVQFRLSGEDLLIDTLDGHPFFSFEQAAQRWLDERQRADDEKKRADDEKKRADDEKKRADDEKQRADDEKQRADSGEQRMVRLVELGRKVRRGQATAEEIEELERLEQQVASTS
jgi:hypothetical protein